VAPLGYRELVRSYLDLRWQLDPVAATMAGVGEYDERLGHFGRADVKAAVAALKAMGGAFEEAATDTLADEVDQTAVLNEIRHTIARYDKEKPHELNPEFHLSHLLSGLFSLLVRRDQPPQARGRAIAGRLREVPRFLADAREALGRPAPVFTETALDVAEGGRALLGQAVPEFASSLPLPVAEEIGAALADARAAYDDFADFVAGPLAKRSDGAFAVGREAFDFRLHYEHALLETAPEILRYGETLLRETERELSAIAAQLAPGVPWRALAERLRIAHPPGDTIVPAYAGQMERARRFVLEHAVATVPEGDLEVIATPSFMTPLVPFAAYDPPGAFSADRTGWFYVTEVKGAGRRDHCTHEIACTALHEGWPGHHLQFLAAQAQLSPVRRVISSPLTVEGWALYCEELMAELGFLTRPEERFFQRLHLLWRAARIVLDVRLHTAGMGVEEAVRFLIDTLGIGRPSAEAEVRRYCGAPAYQLCYAVGRREFLRLREAYRARSGSAFSLRAFHDDVLGYGGLPVSLIRWGMGLPDDSRE
jgi:hypothetical protein